MIKKKICLLGPPGVGKTSLVARFVKSIYSENYHATVGAKVDKKTVLAGPHAVELMIWDMAGDTAERLAHSPYLRGAAGHLVVADGTRPETVEEARRLMAEVLTLHGAVPIVFAINKCDLKSDWAIGETDLAPHVYGGDPPILTSAKDGERVELAFITLAERMLAAEIVA